MCRELYELALCTHCRPIMTASRICHHRPAMRAESQSCSQSFIPLDQRSENDSSGSNHFRHVHTCSEPDNQNSVISFVISKWLLLELSFSDCWSRGTKLWERDFGRELDKKALCTHCRPMMTIYIIGSQFYIIMYYSHVIIRTN